MRAAKILALLAALGCAVWYLRDPPWLLTQSSGLRPPERTADGAVYRWSGGHASFFVPADARTVRIPLATTFDARGSSPMVVTVFVDDARTAGLVLTDDAWHEVTVPLPRKGSRRVRRIDVKTNVVREDNHGVKIGDVQPAGR